MTLDTSEHMGKLARETAAITLYKECVERLRLWHACDEMGSHHAAKNHLRMASEAYNAFVANTEPTS